MNAFLKTLETNSRLVDAPDGEVITPVRIAVPDEALDDLRARLARTRWTEELPDAGWDFGVPLARIRPRVEAWTCRYDWRTWERRLNAHAQYVTSIDGQRIHFLHLRSANKDALPLLMLHGWPGSIAEFLDIIPRLSARDAMMPGDLAFHLVIPSLPGFGFSGPTRERGWNTVRMAHAFATLMSRLGYQRYGVYGNDWGSYIAPEVGRCAPDAVAGVHVTQLFSGPIGEPGELDGLTPDEAAAFAANRTWVEDIGGAYAVLQAQQPQTLAHALADSPAGLLGWFCQIFRDAGDDDFVLTQASIHWLTGTVASAMRIYREHAREPRIAEPTPLPLALSQFRDDHRAVRRFARRDHANIVSWKIHDTGGHYAAHQEPALLAADLREFFTPLATTAGLPRASPR